MNTGVEGVKNGSMCSRCSSNEIRESIPYIWSYQMRLLRISKAYVMWRQHSSYGTEHLKAILVCNEAAVVRHYQATHCPWDHLVFLTFLLSLGAISMLISKKVIFFILTFSHFYWLSSCLQHNPLLPSMLFPCKSRVSGPWTEDDCKATSPHSLLR